MNLPVPKLDALPLGAHRLSVLTDQRLFEQAGVRIAFTGRDGGVSEGVYASLNTAGHVGDDPARVFRNRSIVAQAARCADVPIVVPSQVHGTDVLVVDARDQAERLVEQDDPVADAVLITVPGVAALMNFADCLPLIVVSPTGRFVVAHAGWRGAVAGIAGTAVRALADADAADNAARDPISAPAAFNAYIGPHIGPECFEVGVDVAQRFLEAYGEAVLADGRHVNLAAAVTADLAAAGLCQERICLCGICTKCHPQRYYSYRASRGECGRHAAFAYRSE